MRLIDRLYDYMAHHNLTPYAFEHACGISNGYLAKQKNGKGSVGSEMLERIHQVYPDLNLIWLINGSGAMLVNADQHLSQAHTGLLLVQLQQQIKQLEKTIQDKERIIRLLEQKNAQSLIAT